MHPESDDDATIGLPRHAVRFRSVITHPPVRTLVSARMAVSMAGSAVFYGVLVNLAREGASQFAITFASAISFAAVLALGRQGGLVADSVSKRRLLFISLLAQGVLCFAVPVFVGASYLALASLIFLTTALNLLAAPAFRTAVVLVAAKAEVATVAALIALVGIVGAAIGSSIVAPLLLKGSGIVAALSAAGVLYLVGALLSRLLPLDRGDDISLRDVVRRVDWKPSAMSFRFNARWIASNPSVASMILGGIIVGVLYQSLHMLLPGYMSSVLHEDPANVIFIFLPAGIGLVIGALVAPWMIGRLGPRRLLLLSLGLITAGMVLLGSIVEVAPLFAPFNPMGLVDPLLGIQVSAPMMAAGVIALPANLGSAWAVQSVQVFINLTVPRAHQGEVFGIQKVQTNLLLMIMIPTFGFLATRLGTEVVFIVAPLVVATITLLLIRLSSRYITGHAAPAGMAVRFIAREGEPDDDAAGHEPPR